MNDPEHLPSDPEHLRSTFTAEQIERLGLNTSQAYLLAAMTGTIIDGQHRLAALEGLLDERYRDARQDKP
ncbi:MAG: hypothetical protein ABWX96_17615 [Propionibacteriaceae bacterium]